MADLPITSDNGAQPVIINDPTTTANVANVKAASTAAIATDNSLVVALSPNSPVSGAATTAAPTYSTGTTNPLSLDTAGNLRVASSQPDLVATGTLGALNASVQVAMAGYQGAGFEISTGTLISTLTPQVSMDGGTTWSATSFFNPATGLLAATLTTTNAMPNTQLSIVVPGGVSHVRVAVTAYTSGSSTASIRATVDSMQPVIDAPALAVLNTIATNTGASATDFISTGTITALNGTVSVNGQGVYTVSASITGTWVGTLIAEGQLADNTWVQIPIYQVQSTSLPYSYLFSTTSNGTFLITGGGYLNIRIRASAYTSGTVNVALDGSLAQQTISSAQLGQWNVGGYSANTSGSIAGNGNILLLPVGTFGPFSSLSAYAGIVIEISGTWNATLTLTGSNGNSFYTIDVINLSNPDLGPQSTITANGLYYAPLGCVSMALAASNYVSGTVICYASLRAIPPQLLPIVDGDIDVTGTLGALNATVQETIGSGQSSAYALISGTWVGTIQFQGSINGTTWVPLEAVQGGPTNAYTTAGFTTNGGVRIALLAGFQYVRAQMIAYTSGTATVTIQASTGVSNTESIQFNAANLNAQVQGPVASGTVVSGNPVLIGASDGTNAQTLRANPVNNGVESLLIQNNENLRQTYSIELSNYAIAGAPTDVFILIGSATKTIRVVNVQFSMTATTAVTVPVQLIKRSAANTGGTSGVASITPWDSNNAASTATNLAYNVNPTALGAVVGTGIRSIKYFAPLTTAQSVVINWDLGIDNCQPVVLRGTSQLLCINLGGTTIVGGTISASFTWTEDNV